MYDAACELVRKHAGTDDADDVMEAMTRLHWYDVAGTLQHRAPNAFYEFFSYVRERNVDETMSDDNTFKSYNRARASKDAWSKGARLLSQGEVHQRIGELIDDSINAILIRGFVPPHQCRGQLYN